MMMKMNSPSISMPTCGSVMFRLRPARFAPARLPGRGCAAPGGSTLSVSSTSCRRCGQAPRRMHRTQRMISATPWISRKTPATGISVFSGNTGMPAGLKMLTSLNRMDRQRVRPACVHERQHRREEEQDVEREVHARLRARLPEAIEHVAAHMTVARQRIGAGHQKQRAVVDITEIEGPGRRRAQNVAHEHLVADAEGQHQDQPGERLADPGAERVDEVQEPSYVRSGCGDAAFSLLPDCGAAREAPAPFSYVFIERAAARSDLQHAREVMVERAAVIGRRCTWSRKRPGAPIPSASPSPSS